MSQGSTLGAFPLRYSVLRLQAERTDKALNGLGTAYCSG